MVRSLFYVLILLLLYFIIQFIFFPTTPNRLLAKQICIAPSGCKIEMDTGFCHKCIELEEPPIIKEEKVIVEKKPVVKVSNPPLYPQESMNCWETKLKQTRKREFVMLNLVIGWILLQGFRNPKIENQ